MGVLGHPTSATQPPGLDVLPWNQPATGTTGSIFLVPGGKREGVGCKKPPFRMQWGTRNHQEETIFLNSVAVFLSLVPTPAESSLPHPQHLWVEDLMPQALQRGVPSSASLQSGVLWVLQEAQRLGSGVSEVKRHRVKGQKSISEARVG